MQFLIQTSKQGKVIQRICQQFCKLNYAFFRLFFFSLAMKTCILVLQYLTVFQWQFELTAYHSRHIPVTFSYMESLKLKWITSKLKKKTKY